MITFSIDAMPLTKKIIDSNDYTSKIIYSAVCDTLFKYDIHKKAIVKNACNKYIYTNFNKYLVITLRDDLFYSNGIKITSKDYFEHFKLLLILKNHIGIIFQRFFDKVEIIDEYTIKLRNKIRNNRSYEILSIYTTGCLCENVFSGPYYISKINDDSIYLKRNNYYRKKINNIEADELRFILTDGVNDYKLFNKNIIQISNNTMAYTNMIKNEKYIREDNNIYLNISFSPKLMCDDENNIKNILAKIIDKSTISKILDNAYEPCNTFIADGNQKFKISKVKNKCKKYKFKKIYTLGFNDFYPNYIIAMELKKQLNNIGIKIKLKKNKFNINNENDLNIVLNHIEYISVSALINGSFLYVILNAFSMYKILLIIYNITHKKFLLEILNKKLIKLNYKIPVLKMCGYYLKNEKFNNFNYIELNYDEL